MNRSEKAKEALNTAKQNLDKAIAKVARQEKKLAEAEFKGDDFEIRWANYDLRCANSILKRAKANYEKKLAAVELANEDDNKISNLPSVVKKMIKHVKDECVKNMLNVKKEMRDLYNNDREKYEEQTTWAKNIMRSDEEDIEKVADVLGEEFALELVERTSHIVGKITDWSDLSFTIRGLNGVVKGTNGTAEVTTVRAGGYNIQRLHYRVLVKRRSF